MYQVEEKLLQVILQYLAGRPYQEVYQLINEIQKLKPIEVKSEA